MERGCSAPGFDRKGTSSARALRTAVRFPAPPAMTPYSVELARPEGLEPPTPRFEAWYSIQLSYGRLRGRHNVRCRVAPSKCTRGRRGSGTGPAQSFELLRRLDDQASMTVPGHRRIGGAPGGPSPETCRPCTRGPRRRAHRTGRSAPVRPGRPSPEDAPSVRPALGRPSARGACLPPKAPGMRRQPCAISALGGSAIHHEPRQPSLRIQRGDNKQANREADRPVPGVRVPNTESTVR